MRIDHVSYFFVSLPSVRTGCRYDAAFTDRDQAKPFFRKGFVLVIEDFSLRNRRALMGVARI